MNASSGKISSLLKGLRSHPGIRQTVYQTHWTVALPLIRVIGKEVFEIRTKKSDTAAITTRSTP